VQRLEIEAISQASPTNARDGAAAWGPASAFGSTARRTSPPAAALHRSRIVRTNLASVILQMASLRLGKVEDFPFLDPPDARLVKDGYDTLVGARRRWRKRGS
jgi:ATP-dependent helicase HrpA